jgi:tetratricopeptide (TPR) repeat protein
MLKAAALHLPIAALFVATALRAQTPRPEATSLLGRPLARPTLPDDFRAEQEALLAEARERLAADSEDLEAWIWVGRRTAYLGLYREAIAVFSDGLDRFPDSVELLRHRGHRHITLRDFGAAEDDLARAAALRAGLEDDVEADGLPNAAGIPTSTLHTNIAYHLGLARYLQGDFEGALEAYRWCWEISDNPDMKAAAAYWLYLTLRRVGRHAEAEELAASIGADWELLENHDYYRLLLAYRDGGGADKLFEEARQGTELAGSTVGYGVGAWHLLEGRPERAREIFDEIVAGEGWAAFGYIAAEAELVDWMAKPVRR